MNAYQLYACGCCHETFNRQLDAEKCCSNRVAKAVNSPTRPLRNTDYVRPTGRRHKGPDLVYGKKQVS